MPANPCTLKCGCIFDGKSFVKYCREHALMVLRKRWEKYEKPEVNDGKQ